MNKYKEAFMRLDKNVTHEYPGMANDLVVIEELIELSIEKFPQNIRVVNRKLGRLKAEIMVGNCPNCGERVDTLDFPYQCSRKECGQRLKWIINQEDMK